MKRSLVAVIFAVMAVGLEPRIAHGQCIAPPSGLVSWWRGETNAYDSVGANNATPTAITYGNGEVGKAFVYDGSSSRMTVPASSALAVTNFTIEAWVFPADQNKSMPVVDYGQSGQFSPIQLWINTTGGTSVDPGALHAVVRSAATGFEVDAPGALVPSNQWTHIAFTYTIAGTNCTGVLYCNGIQVASASTIPAVIPPGLTAVNIGYRDSGSTELLAGYKYKGSMDEVAIYRRALSASEIQSIYNAGSAGKCPVLAPPTIVTQPTGRTVTVGGTTTFNVTANGTAPLSCRWKFNGTNITGATSASLTLTNVQPGQAGNYSVMISNIIGSVTSSNAMLTVTSAVVSCVSAPSGMAAWWPAEGDANDVIGSNNGTLVNGVTFATGISGSAFSFNNSGTQSINIPASASLNLTNQVTIEFWMKADPTNNLNSFQGLVTSDNYLVSVDVGNPNLGVFGLDFAINDNGTFYQTANANGGGPRLSSGVWHHVAGTYDGTKLQLYVDGQPTGNPMFHTGHITPIPAGGFLAIGSEDGRISCGCTGRHFWGLIDEASIYNRALSASEIQSIYSAGALGKCMSLVAPTITSQPASQTVMAGQNTTFTVLANGTAPLSYRWKFNGTNITGATSASLTLTNIQLSQAGNYSVTVSNIVGSTNSINAVLTVNALATCTGAPSGLVAWWQAEGNANDVVGGNNGTPNGALGYAAGEQGQAFVFDGSTSYITMPPSASLNVGVNSGLTIEAWVKPNANVTAPVIEWDSTTTDGVQLWVENGSKQLYSNIKDTSGVTHNFAFQYTFDTNHFQHVAVTYDKSSGLGVLYLNGTNVATANLGTFTPQTTYPANIGRRTGQPVGLNDTYGGMIDELSLYNRALSASEIQSIYSAGSGGKCSVIVAPTITGQPTNRTVAVGQSATFTVTSAGTAPLSYQWRFNGGAIGGATSASLTLTNIRSNQAGNYSVVVTNVAGSVTSSNALLTVTGSSSCVSAPSGLMAWWQGEGNTLDSAGSNHGSFVGPALYTNGVVGQAFGLNGANYVSIPDSPAFNVLTNTITIEAWIRVNFFDPNLGFTAIVAKGDSSWRVHRYGSSSNIAFSTTGLSQGDLQGGRNVNDGQWHHIAAVYDGSTKYIYVDGTLDVSAPATGSISLNTYPVCIGENAEAMANGWADRHFNGAIDEVSVYHRALSASEIQGVYQAGAAGKCTPFFAPAIVTQPTNRTVTVGQSTTFTVSATGTAPLGYQWRFNGTNIAGATGSSLTLTNVQPVQAGNYSVRVTNFVGSVISSNALLTVSGSRVTITSQPAAQWVVVGGTTTFNVTATGTAPLTYQWKFNGGDITGATSSSLTLTNIQSGNAGNYSVAVTNPFGPTNSLSAALTVVTSCADAPSGQVAWWRAETNTADVFQTHNGTFVNGSAFTNGMVGKAFNFTGSNYISVPDAADLNPTNAITIECWINHQAIAGSFDAVVKKSGVTSVTSADGYSLEFSGGGLLFWVYSSNGGWQSSGAAVPLQLGTWYHVAGVYDGTHLMVYTNGHLAAVSAVTGTIIPSPNSLCIGNDPQELVRYFKGGIDEVSIYNRALSSGEIANVYHDSSFGKCEPLFPPVIVTQPTNRTVTAGQSTTFAVTATGTAPLSYQWKVNGTNIAGATNPTLALDNVQAGQAGDYSVTVSNVVGTVDSATATLTVNVPPSITTQPVDQTVVLGQTAAFAVVAAGTAPLNYQWTFNGTNIVGATNAALVIDHAQSAQAGVYAVQVSNVVGSTNSIGATLIVNVPPFIITTPTNRTVNLGGNMTFTVTAGGTAPLGYQWKFNGVSITGATNTLLALSNVQLSQAGNYSIQVSNIAGSTNSIDAVLKVNIPPVADASATIPLVISVNGSNAIVILDGSRSHDLDGNDLEYSWYGSATNFLTNGAVAVVTEPIGTNVITLVVSDGLASDQDTAAVEVITLDQAVNRLIDITSPMRQSLIATLRAALASIERGDTTSALNQLRTFQNKVNVQLMPVDPDTAQMLINDAQAIIDAIEGYGGLVALDTTLKAEKLAGKLHLTFSGAGNRNYIIEASSDLVHWEKVGVATGNGNGHFQFDDSSGKSQRYYRVIAP